MRPIDADVLLQRAVSHGWSTPKWVSDIAIDDAPTIEVKPRWIPCSERLPEEDHLTGYERQYSLDVLMSVHNRVDDETIVDYGHTVDGRWFSVTADTYLPDNWKVTAWMPLPEPYKEENNETD